MSGGGGSVGEEDANVEAGHLWEKQDDCSLCVTILPMYIGDE